MKFRLGILKLVSELKLDLGSKSYDVVPMCISSPGGFRQKVGPLSSSRCFRSRTLE